MKSSDPKKLLKQYAPSKKTFSIIFQNNQAVANKALIIAQKFKKQEDT